MSAVTVTTKKDVEVEGTAEFDIDINGVSCDCGEELKFDACTDNWGDINIAVQPHTCIQEEES